MSTTNVWTVCRRPLSLTPRFSGVQGGPCTDSSGVMMKTVETVQLPRGCVGTPLKRGVNEKRLAWRGSAFNIGGA